MTIVPIVPDAPLAPAPAPASPALQGEFFDALDRAANALTRADSAEDAFAAHVGSLQDAVFERAQADVVLSIATAAAQRTVQAAQSVLNMQI